LVVHEVLPVVLLLLVGDGLQVAERAAIAALAAIAVAVAVIIDVLVFAHGATPFTAIARRALCGGRQARCPLKNQTTPKKLQKGAGMNK